MRLRKRCPALVPPLSRPTPCQHQSLEPSPYGGKSFPLHGCSRSRQRHDSQVAGTCGCPGVGGQVEENVPPGGVTRAVLLTRQGRLGQGTALAPTGHRPAYAPAAAVGGVPAASGVSSAAVSVGVGTVGGQEADAGPWVGVQQTDTGVGRQGVALYGTHGPPGRGALACYIVCEGRG